MFYVTDSSSHNVLTGERAIELHLICLHHTTSNKHDECAKLQEESVVKVKNVKANKKQSDDSKIPKRLEKLINYYQQKRFTGSKIGKLKDTKINFILTIKFLRLLRQSVVYHLH